jgi:PST family polysaccharide transporter
MVPALSRLVADPERYRLAFLRTLGQIQLATLPGVVYIVVMSDVFVPTVFGARWREAAPIVTILGLVGLLQPLNSPSGWLFISQGRSSELMRWGFFGATTSITAFTIGLPFGPLGVATAYAVGEYIKTPLLWWYLTRHGPVLLADVLRTSCPQFAGAAVSLLAVSAVRVLTSQSVLMILLVGPLIISYGVSLLVVACFSSGRARLADIVYLVQSTRREL